MAVGAQVLVHSIQQQLQGTAAQLLPLYYLQRGRVAEAVHAHLQLEDGPSASGLHLPTSHLDASASPFAITCPLSYHWNVSALVCQPQAMLCKAAL